MRKMLSVLRFLALPLAAALAALLAAKGMGSYYLWSFALIALTLGAFFLRFENRHPGGAELATLAVLCALAVASRAVFAAFPHFKPMAAVIMLAGIAFGAEAGFLCGAVSAFVSNFFFGQGLWTPWQMLAFGLAGFVAGLLRRLHLLPAVPQKIGARLGMALAGFLTVLLAVGPVLDCFSLLVFSGEQTDVAAIFLAGLLPNTLHALATALLLFVCGRPVLEELQRLKQKYGIGEGRCP